MTAGKGVRHERVRLSKAATDRHPTALIAVGCSLGGLQALKVILEGLPASYPIPIAVAQHRHSTSAGLLAPHLQRPGRLPVEDAEDQQPIEGCHVYLAPSDYHLIVERGTFRVSVDDAVRHSRPSIDVLFESAADAYRQYLVGVVLTGSNADGAIGAARIKKWGGLVIVQDPREAEAPEMPAATIAMTSVDQVLPLAGIAPFLTSRLEYAQQE